MTNRTTADAAPPAASDGGRVVTPRHDAGRPVPPRAEPPVGAMTPAVEVAQLVGVRVGADPSGVPTHPFDRRPTDPVSIPTDPSGRPGTYLSAPPRRRSRVSDVDSTPLFPFGHGLGQHTFTWSGPRAADRTSPTNGEVEVARA